MSGGAARRSTLPGFGLTMGLTLTWLSVIILIPLAGLFLRTFELSLDQFWDILTSRRTLNALKISFGLSFAAALVNLVMGTIIVWALVRYRFPGRRLFDAIVDIPFALPTAVAGVALTSLFAQKGWLGAPLAVVDKVADQKGTRAVAEAYLKYWYTKEGQEIAARNSYRPRDAAVAKKYEASFAKVDLFTIDDVFGGWQKAQAAHFNDAGVFDKIYTQ